MSYINENSIQDKEEREKVEKVLRKLAETDKKKFWICKRVFSVILSSFGIIVTSIPMGIIALSIFISDWHSPIYSQKRVGRFGKEFNIYKFRTMIPNADKMVDSLMNKNEMSGPVFKIGDDPRITKLGKFLRKTSLDELPQLFNVVKGDMVLIGPRPPLPREVKQYTEYQKIRLIVTPGITCIWQVHPKRNSVSFDEWIDMDIEYIMKRNIFLDIKLVFQTIRAMLSAEGE